MTANYGQINDLRGKTALLTGGTSGIGREVAYQLAQRGAHVIISGRSAEKGAAIVKQAQERGGSMQFLQADLSEMEQVHQLAAHFRLEHDRLDILVHSAGIHFYERKLTSDGIEYNFAANYLNRFVLTELLIDMMRQTVANDDPARILIVGSPYVFDPVRFFNLDGIRGEQPIRPIVGLLKSGMANSIWTVELARRIGNGSVTVRNMQPGIVRTAILRNDPVFMQVVDQFMQPIRGMSAEQAGRNYAQLATQPETDNYKDQLFRLNTRGGIVPSKVPARTFDKSLAASLWAFSEQYVRTEPIPAEV